MQFIFRKGPFTVTIRGVGFLDEAKKVASDFGFPSVENWSFDVWPD
jgi:hypothetical protein